MRLQIEKFHVEHMTFMERQPHQAAHEHFDRAYYETLGLAGPAFTVRAAGRVLLCGGAVTYPEGAHLWAVVSRHARPHMLGLHRAVLRFMEAYGPEHYTATVDVDFKEGCRWLELLGFHREPDLPEFAPSGRRHGFFSRKPR